MKNLWPKDLTDRKINTPITILKKQAALLGEQTNNIVEAEIENINTEFWMEESGFSFSFNIVGRVLNYKFNLFRMGHGVNLYPLSINVDEEVFNEIKTNFSNSDYNNVIIIQSESEFLDSLEKIFSSYKTRRVIQAIFAQSES